MQRFLPMLLILILLLTDVLCRSLYRQERDVQAVPPGVHQVATSNRQLGSGLSALGTLVSPLLFLMGMGSFISMLPQMFQTVLSGVGSNLIQSFTGGAAGANNPSSFRLRRAVDAPPAINEDYLEELARRINQAVLEDGRLH